MYIGNSSNTFPIKHIQEYNTHVCMVYVTCRGLCNRTYPDVVCRNNYTLHSHNPPLLYDLATDPSEVYNLNPTEHKETLLQIEQACTYIDLLVATSLNNVQGCYYVTEPFGNVIA